MPTITEEIASEIARLNNELNRKRAEHKSRFDRVWQDRYNQNLAIYGSDRASSEASYAVKNDYMLSQLQEDINSLPRKIEHLCERKKSLENSEKQAKQQQQAAQAEQQRRAEFKQSINPGASAESLTKRGYIFLEDSEWEKATAYFDNALDINPEYAQAYVGLLCVELKITSEEELASQKKLLTDDPNFKKTMRFADENYRIKLEQYDTAIKERIAEQQQLEQERRAEQERIAEEKRQKEEQERKERERQEQERRAEQERIAEQKRKEEQERHEKQMQDCKKIRERIAKYQGCIFADYFHTVGLKADGTVVAVGYNEDGRCNVQDWRDVIAVSAGYYHTVGLKANGTVVATGNNSHGECNVQDWRDVVAVSAGGSYTVGLKADGTVIAVGFNYYGQCNIQDWRDIGPSTEERRLKRAKEDEEQFRRENEQRREAQERERREDEQRRQAHEEEHRRKEEQSKLWASQGLCRYCGNGLGLFKKCKSPICGKKN